MSAPESASSPGNSLHSFTGTPEAYVDLISDNWNWTYGTMMVTEMCDNWLEKYWEVKLVTGGWSENEETLWDIERTMFHLLFWESTHRGGLTVYHIPVEKWAETWELGQL